MLMSWCKRTTSCDEGEAQDGDYGKHHFAGNLLPDGATNSVQLKVTASTQKPNGRRNRDSELSSRLPVTDSYLRELSSPWQPRDSLLNTYKCTIAQLFQLNSEFVFPEFGTVDYTFRVVLVPKRRTVWTSLFPKGMQRTYSEKWRYIKQSRTCSFILFFVSASVLV